MSSLNPYAAEYVPLSKRQVDNRICLTGKARDWGLVVGPGASQRNEPLNSYSRIVENNHIPSRSPWTSHSHAYGSPPQRIFREPRGNILGEEEYEIDLDYLQSRFPEMSYQSLIDAYLLNDRDVDATVDMVMDLESDIESGNLPETLDIGDIQESAPSADGDLLKSKTVSAEPGTSSSL